MTISHCEQNNPAPPRDVVVVHSSDVHLEDDGNDMPGSQQGSDTTAALGAVLNAARTLAADLLVLAGDTFDSHRLRPTFLDRVAGLISGSGIPVVLLPGNHDPAVSNSVYVHPALGAATNLHVIGYTHDEAVLFHHLELEVWGRPHRHYGDMIPLEHPRRRSSRWQIALAHGHYTPVPDRTTRLRPSWLIGDDELAATEANYIGLGHWNRHAIVGTTKKAYYSGSPSYAGTVNLVRLTAEGGVEVKRAELDLPREPCSSG